VNELRRRLPNDRAHHVRRFLHTGNVERRFIRAGRCHACKYR